MMASPPSAQPVDAVGDRHQLERPGRTGECQPAAALGAEIARQRGAALRLDRDEPVRRCARSAATRRRATPGRVERGAERRAPERQEPRPPHRPAARPGNSRTNRSSARWMKLAALGRAGIGVERLERREAEHVARIDRIGIAHPGLDLGDREPARPGGDRRARLGRRASGIRCAASSSRRWPGERLASRRRARPSSPPARSTVSSRSSQRDGTVGVPSTRAARVSTTSRAPSAWAKSCAAMPTRRSGGGRPKRCRIGRDSHGSLCGLGRPHALVEAAQHDAGRHAAAAPRAGPR